MHSTTMQVAPQLGICIKKFRRILHVKFNCDGENGKLNIARVTLAFMLEVCPFVDGLHCQHFRLTIA